MTKEFIKMLSNLSARITQPLALAFLGAKPLAERIETVWAYDRLSVFAAKCADIAKVPTLRVYVLDGWEPNIAVMNWDSDRPILLVSDGVLSFFEHYENTNADDNLTGVVAQLFAHDNKMEISINPMAAIYHGYAWLCLNQTKLFPPDLDTRTRR